MEKEILTTANIEIGVSLNTKEEAIRYAGKVLLDNGYIEAAYIDKMIERDKVSTTYIGNKVAIPHGTEDAKESVEDTGLSIVITKDSVSFDGNDVNILIGIAAKGNEHLEILSKIAIVCSEDENIERIIHAQSKQEIIDIFGEVN
ncbi:mannitol-specific phosphotransferase enzyme IIA component [Halolactibacillus miurensis]|uniref:Mannitol-specific phosphotransferase enzyme IIA component n=1 Tax=Halolactibacillus miurensis TaxID=306541 RepID=A0A1I6TYJ3_9BACI|nr:PTS sugar transporter subunit IIA [Halolactibacillus miurensis]GEM04850.1 mannitol-specific phosphotransferase enzyme IIA component [Halolactibacillus miurensis]SFS94250.1 PTS system, mannitol-specific IIA component [Halolactibacillus miurensis]